MGARKAPLAEILVSDLGNGMKLERLFLFLKDK